MIRLAVMNGGTSTSMIDFIDSPEFPTLDPLEVLATFTEESKTPPRTNRLASRTLTPILRMCESALLSPEDERRLFCRMNFAKYCLSRDWFGGKSRKVHHRSQFRRIAEHDRNALVSSNVRLVVSIAKKFSSTSVTMEELLSDGIETLIRAVEKFDYTRGFRFSTYATLAIRRALYRSIANRKNERERQVDIEWEDMVVDPSGPGSIPDARWEQLQSRLSVILGRLDPREMRIVQRRFGLEGDNAVTLQEIADDMGICKERVRQIERRAITKLRGFVDDADAVFEMQT